MTDHDPNDIEQRLHAMKPAEPGHAVKQRIAESLDTHAAEHPTPARSYRFAIAALAAAAAVAISAWSILYFTQPPPPDTAPLVRHTPPGATGPDQPDPVNTAPTTAPTQPTLIALSRAWRRSPAALDAALDAAISAPNNNNPAKRPSSPRPTIYRASDALRLNPETFP